LLNQQQQAAALAMHMKTHVMDDKWRLYEVMTEMEVGQHLH
jgi:hypothetical protein